MNAFNLGLVATIVVVCMSLVTSRQQQRLDFASIERAQAQSRRLDQDFQNLTAKQQQLEQTERIERIARQERGMERIPAARTIFLAQGGLP
jgi:cell division protein FtsL